VPGEQRRRWWRCGEGQRAPPRRGRQACCRHCWDQRRRRWREAGWWATGGEPCRQSQGPASRGAGQGAGNNSRRAGRGAAREARQRQAGAAGVQGAGRRGSARRRGWCWGVDGTTSRRDRRSQERKPCAPAGLGPRVDASRKARDNKVRRARVAKDGAARAPRGYGFGGAAGQAGPAGGRGGLPCRRGGCVRGPRRPRRGGRARAAAAGGRGTRAGCSVYGGRAGEVGTARRGPLRLLAHVGRKAAGVGGEVYLQGGARAARRGRRQRQAPGSMPHNSAGGAAEVFQAFEPAGCAGRGRPAGVACLTAAPQCEGQGGWSRARACMPPLTWARARAAAPAWGAAACRPRGRAASP
jgi:hypothetical protein